MSTTPDEKPSAPQPASEPAPAAFAAQRPPQPVFPPPQTDVPQELHSATTDPAASGTTRPRRRRAWIRPVAGALACIAVGGVLGFGIAKIELPSGHPLAEALKTCGLEKNSFFELGDSGASLTIQGKGKKDSGAASTDIACVLQEIKTPDSAVSRMDQTRALDGRQSASWKGYAASWTYHPDHGLNLVVESSQS